MRRAANQVFRTARRAQVRRNFSWKGFPISSPSHVLRLRRSPALIQRDQSLTILQSSMYFRNFSVALVSAAVASGVWYTYRGTSAPESGVLTTTSRSSTASPTPSHFSTSSAFAGSTRPTTGSITSEDVSESTRRALVVENDQFYTGDIVGDKPLTKETEGSDRLVVEMLNPEQATQRLRQNEESYAVGRGQGVVRYDVVQLASNHPIEDDHAEKIVAVPQDTTATPGGSGASDWMFWGVFDGHSGWPTSAKLRQVLISYVVRELNMTYKSALTNPVITYPSPESIDTAIKSAFLRLDHEIVHESVEKVTKMGNSKRIAAELLAPALSGSCALLSFYDSKSKLLRVACTGDSRAVLGRRGPSGKWTAMPLSEDLTGGTPSEIARLRAEHPGEEFVTNRGRILGSLEPSRAFGDAIYKWSRETAGRMKESFFGRSPSPYSKTPPYVTAEPVVTTTQVNPEKGDFLVMATDGLWECLTNEEVIGLVGQWMDKQSKSAFGSAKKSWLSHADSSLPVEKAVTNGKRREGQRSPIRQDQWGVDGGDERFVVEDKNVATHLVRNALGGKDRDMVCALLTLPSPYARRYRDDLTVEVIFFGEGDNSGTVVPIPEAHASKTDIKSKL
ncbi:hypothetical protein MMC13_001766 [Lambiella insularis]|nr:hypothetical protein [Lambiella insularis]